MATTLCALSLTVRVVAGAGLLYLAYFLVSLS
jgi:hypothetical protein